MADYIQIIAVLILRFLMRLTNIFPVREKRVLFSSFRGTGYSCNPKYISEAMECEGTWEIIWAMHDGEKQEGMDKVKVCKYHSLLYFYYLATCKVAVDNVGFISIYPRKKKQLFINTWHGGGCYKNVGLAEENSYAMQMRKRISSKNTNLYISSSQFFSGNVVRGQFNYSGEILEKGMPRNDLLINQNEKKREDIDKKIRKKYNINSSTRILLYAPTWRYSENEDIYIMSFEMIVNVLRQRFSGEWVVFYRLHHFSRTVGSCKVQREKFIISADDYPDMQELLLISDVLITDYSSSIWDFSFTYKPCFLFVKDLFEYNEVRGFVKDIYTWGFPVCKTEEELLNAIYYFDAKEHMQRMMQHHEDLQSFETGHAGEEIVQYIKQYPV